MTIPLLAFPTINRGDLLSRALASIDVEPDRLIVIDNSRDGLDFDCPPHLSDLLEVIVPAANLGFGGSVNHAICGEPGAAWWCIANADVEFGKGDLARLAEEMAQGGPRWVGINDWRVFGLSREAVERVGYFDQSFFPAYLEDCDYEYRCSLTGVPWYFIPGTTEHVGSAAIRSDDSFRRSNERSYAANLAYYREKWGGGHRGGEVYRTPFNRGGHPREWVLPSPSRLRDLQWR